MGLFSFLSFFPKLAQAGWFSNKNTDIPTVPPGKFKWDIGPKDSRIEQEFMVEEYRPYYFEIGFGSPIAWNDKEHQEWRKDKRVWDFIGDGGTGYANNKGVVIPIHIIIEQITDGKYVFITDQFVSTESMTHGGELIGRKIITQKLKPGRYRVIAKTLQETILPSGIGTYLCIGSHPKTNALKDNE